MAQDATDKTLNEVFKEACQEFMAGVHPDHREYAKRTLAGFLSQAQMVGYKSGWTDGQAAGPKPKSLSELLAEEEPVLSDGLRNELYDVVAEARRGGGIEGGIDYSMRALEGIVEDAIKEAKTAAKTERACPCGYLGRVHTGPQCNAPVKSTVNRGSCTCGAVDRYSCICSG